MASSRYRFAIHCSHVALLERAELRRECQGATAPRRHDLRWLLSRVGPPLARFAGSRVARLETAEFPRERQGATAPRRHDWTASPLDLHAHTLRILPRRISESAPGRHGAKTPRFEGGCYHASDRLSLDSQAHALRVLKPQNFRESARAPRRQDATVGPRLRSTCTLTRCASCRAEVRRARPGATAPRRHDLRVAALTRRTASRSIRRLTRCAS